MNQATKTPAPSRQAPEPSPVVLRRKCACGTSAAGETTCAACRSKEEERQGEDSGLLRRSALSPAAGGEDSFGVVPPIVHDVLRSAGQPLDAPTRALLEPHFGHDFSQVRVHADGKAADSARAVNASAYTVGRDLVFGAGQYAPRSAEGRQLIAHELTHVIQQGNGAGSGQRVAGGIRVNEPGDAYERQAEAMAASVAHGASPGPGGRAAPPLSAAPPSVQRQARQGRPAAPASRGPAIVEDRQPTAPGQMRRSDFLTTLRAALFRAVDDEFKRIGRTGKDCPYILRTIERYASGPLSALLRVIRAFAHPPAGADAAGLIRAITERARTVARRIAQREAPKAQAATRSGAPTLPAHDPATIRSQLGSGSPLDSGTRGRMEEAFNSNFASVRVHADSHADQLNAALGARAFTVGQDIAFAAQEYRPGTVPGDMLLAHELAHTIQQGSGQARSPGIQADLRLERQAEQAAESAVAGQGLSAATLRERDGGMRIQCAPVVLAGALIVAEATPEIVVGAEIAAVSTEVVVTDGVIVAATDVAAPAVIEATVPTALEVAAPTALETSAAVSSTSSALSTAATVAAVGGVSVLPSDSPTDEEPESRQCQVVPSCPHLGTNTNNHHDCADLAPPNVYPTCDAYVAPVGSLPGKNFDALDPLGQLWEVKTGDPSTYPPFLQGPRATGIAAALAEIELEDEIALACNRHFILGVTTPGAQTWYQSRLPNIDVRVISC
jgi:hypothetical protein